MFKWVYRNEPVSEEEIPLATQMPLAGKIQVKQIFHFSSLLSDISHLFSSDPKADSLFCTVAESMGTKLPCVFISLWCVLLLLTSMC